MFDQLTPILKSRSRFCGLLICILLANSAVFGQGVPARAVFDVKNFGAKGDGKSLDSPMINSAIEAAAKKGGGLVRLPAGTYRSYSIRLRSNITLQLDQGATLLAADPPTRGNNGYDAPEPNPSDQFQDFGHSHWHNALIWGDGVENVKIIGPGTIDGDGLSRGNNPPRNPQPSSLTAPSQRAAHRPFDPFQSRAHTPLSSTASPWLAGTGGNVLLAGAGSAVPPAPRLNSPADHRVLRAGVGDKAISLKSCHDVNIENLTIYRGGHFAVLATGGDGLRIANVQIDTNRDGIDIDSCKGVTLDHCIVNAPFDDAIALKSSYALGNAKATEQVTISHCKVSGFDVGSVLNGTRRPAPDLGAEIASIGRITFGTESAGGFKHIAISDCSFERGGGVALCSVDGAAIEDITISDLQMKEITSSPIFLRLGERMRAPAGAPTGTMHGITINNVTVENADPRFGSIISGTLGHQIEDVKLSNIRIQYQGGGTKEWAEVLPPENTTTTPQVQMFGKMPAYGFFIRHVKGIEMQNVELSYITADARPPLMIQDVQNISLKQIKADREQGVPFIRMKQVGALQANNISGIADFTRDQTLEESIDR